MANVLILNAARMYKRVMGANPPSSLDGTRIYSMGNLSFLTKPYRCLCEQDQLVNVESIFPKATFLYSYDSPEDAYESGEEVEVVWEDEEWNVDSPMTITANGNVAFFDPEGLPFIYADDGYYLTTSGATRTYYYVDGGYVTEVGTYTPAGDYFYLEPTSGSIAAAGGQANAVQFTVHTSYGSFSVSTTFSWIHTSVSGDVVTVWADRNTLQTQKTGSVSVTSGGQGKAFVVRQDAASATESVEADLLEMWMRSATLDLNGLHAFKSQAHKGVSDSMDVMTIEVTGTSTFTCYIRSWAEHIGSNVYDYLMITNPNVSYPTSSLNYQSADVKAHTKNEYNTGGTSLSDYQAVTFTGLNPNTVNTIYVVFKKDSSDYPQYTENDEGYILLPDTATFVNPYTPAGEIYLFQHDTILGPNYETINANDSYIYPWLNASGAWTITCDKDWVTPMSSGNWHGDSAVTQNAIWCSVEHNDSGEPRYATLTATLDDTGLSATYEITQLG